MPLCSSEQVTSGPYPLNQYRLPGGASRLAALLIAHLCPISSLFAPCDPGAALRHPVLIQRGRATSRNRIAFVTVSVPVADTGSHRQFPYSARTAVVRALRVVVTSGCIDGRSSACVRQNGGQARPEYFSGACD
jgi:hypothetical protein